MSTRRRDFVVFADDWGRHPSSCQHLFARIAREHRVLWVNTIGTRKPTLSAADLARGLEKAREWATKGRENGAARRSDQGGEGERRESAVEVIAPLMTPFDHWGAFRSLNAGLLRRAVRKALDERGFARPILVTTIPNAWGVVGEIDERASIYYCVDDFAEWPGADRESMQAMEAKLLRRVDLVIATSAALVEDKRRTHARVQHLPHGVDWPRFQRTDEPPPAAIAEKPRPRIGYVGLTDERLDVALIEDVARAMPEASFLFVGPRQLAKGPLDEMPNIHFIPPVPYERVPSVLRALDAAILPYRAEGRLAERLSPLKALEILAAGVPLIATPLPELVRLGRGVRIARSAEEVRGALRSAIDVEDEASRNARAQSVREESWESRASHFLELIEQARTRSPKRPAEPRSEAPRSEAPRSEAPLRVTTLTPEDEAAWDELVEASPEGSLYHRSGWARVIRNAFDQKPLYQVAKAGEAIEGVLPLIAFRNPLFGRYLVSMPYLNRGGIVARTERARKALLAKARSLLESTHSKFCELRHESPIDPTLPARTDKVSMDLDVTEGAEALWKAIGPKVRNLIRKAQKAGLTTREADLRDLPAFYEIFAENMRDLGTPVYTQAFFQETLREFPEETRLTLVEEEEGTPVAGGICLTQGDRTEMHWAAASRRALPRSPNMLLYWEAIENAAKTGLQTFCFGRATEGSGPHRFKKQWGAKPTRLQWEYLLAPGATQPAMNPENPKFALAIKAWKKLPVAITKVLGPPIVRHIP